MDSSERLQISEQGGACATRPPAMPSGAGAHSREPARPDARAQTRRDFEAAFWELYATRPIERVTVRELAQRAGYNRGTFYLHYEDIYDLLDSVESDLLEQVERCISDCPEEPSKGDLLALMTRMIKLYQKNRTALVVLMGENGDASFTHRLRALMKSMPLWRASDPALDIPAAERDLLLGQTASGVLSLIADWLSDPRGVSARRLLRLIYDTSIRKL